MSIQDEFPDQAEIVFDHDLAAAYTRLRSRAVEMEKALQWRPIAEGLPDYMTACLVWCPKNENAFCAYYHFYAGSHDHNRVPIWCFFDNDGEILEVKEEVTHWQPLPPPPNHQQTA